MYNTGLVIGKFYPFHKGHQFLVETGLKNCKQLYLILCSTSNEYPFVDLRYKWIKELYPQIKISILYYTDKDDSNDSKLWADLTIKHLGFCPQVVFTSEDYGKLYCQYLNCYHYQVDKERINVPISGTLIRNNPLKYWNYLSKPVRSYYAFRVVIMGPESTGKTTICQKLAKFYNTLWVPEYGREYSKQKLIDKQNIIYQWTSQDFLKIAIEQNNREDSMSRDCNKILICDTNSLATYVWHLRYLNFENEFIYHYVKNPNLIFLMKPDENTPFVQDGTRDGENIRDNMFHDFINILNKYNFKYHIIEGNYDNRFNQIIKLINEHTLH